MDRAISIIRALRQLLWNRPRAPGGLWPLTIVNGVSAIKILAISDALINFSHIWRIGSNTASSYLLIFTLFKSKKFNVSYSLIGPCSYLNLEASMTLDISKSLLNKFNSCTGFVNMVLPTKCEQMMQTRTTFEKTILFVFCCLENIILDNV